MKSIIKYSGVVVTLITGIAFIWIMHTQVLVNDCGQHCLAEGWINRTSWIFLLFLLGVAEMMGGIVYGWFENWCNPEP